MLREQSKVIFKKIIFLGIRLHQLTISFPKIAVFQSYGSNIDPLTNYKIWLYCDRVKKHSLRTIEVQILIKEV